MMKKGLYSLIVISILFGSQVLKAGIGDFIEVTPDTTSASLGTTIPVTACCNGIGDGAYCTDSSIQRDTFSVRAPHISCQSAGIELPSGFYPTNCAVHGKFCNFSAQPGEAERVITVYQHVILRSITGSITQNLKYGDQWRATGWPRYGQPSKWGFDGSGDLNFNREGSYVQAEAVVTTPEDGCTSITNPGAVSGKVALIRRGTCYLWEKVLNAQNAGAVAVVVVNNVDTGVFYMGASSGGLRTTLPAAFISKDDGDTLYATLAVGRSVSIVMGWLA
ncbi:MAG: hypothetical protein K0U52_09775 [Gammaproteobacteria bacterium]|nr:hypothetical protein [Gammaproteobacteria bacterium]